MSYTKGDNRRLITSEAISNDWTGSRVMADTEFWERGNTNIVLFWTPQDTLTHASIGKMGSNGRIPASEPMALVTVRRWIAAPGEQESVK